MSGDAFDANFQRGAMLRQQNRYKEAADFLGQAIAADPDRPEAYAEMALCLNEWGGHATQALRAIDQAIALMPGSAYYRGAKGWILVCQYQYRRALAVAREGVELDPTSIMALNALTNAHTKLSNWKLAEETARRILALDPNNTAALNLRAQALRFQGRYRESREVVLHILSLQPDNAFGHSNAGYSALAVGDHLRANEHFVQALRMEPHSDFARRGLLESLRSRVWLYRFNKRLGSLLHRPATWLNVLVGIVSILGTCALLGVAIALLEKWRTGAGATFITLGFGFVMFYAYLYFYLRVMGNFLLIFDRVGRHALTRREKVKACFPAAIILLIIGMVGAGAGWLGMLSCVLFFGTLTIPVQIPLWIDAWQRRREKRSQ